MGTATPAVDLVLDRARSDPVWFIENVLGSSVHSKQHEIAQGLVSHSEVAVGSCNSAGKTYIAGRLALWFLYCFAPSIVITTAPTNRQVRGQLWKEIRQAHRDALIPLGGDVLTTAVHISPEWYAIGFTAPDYDPDRFKGYHSEHLLVIADEAARITDEIFDGIEAVVTSRFNKLLMIGNPTEQTGRFARALRGGGYDTKAIQISAFDTPNFTANGITLEHIRSGEWEDMVKELPYPALVTPSWVRGQWEQHGEMSPKWEYKVLGKIPQFGESAIFPRLWVEQADRPPESGYDKYPLYAGIDVAGPGSDETVVYIRQGINIVAWKAFSETDSRGPVMKMLKPYKERLKGVFIDTEGMGQFFAAHFRDAGFTVYSVLAKESATDSETFHNRKAEFHFSLRARLEEGRLANLTDPVTKQQLEAIREDLPDPQGRIRIEGKKEMARRGVVSPDRAEALMMAFLKPPKKRKVVWSS